jgi:hypothetical protein
MEARLREWGIRMTEGDVPSGVREEEQDVDDSDME